RSLPDALPIFGYTEAGLKALVALVLQRVTAHAVVHVQLGAALQHGLIPDVGPDMIEMNRSARGKGRQREQCNCKSSENFLHFVVTRSGTGLVFSMEV